MRQKNNNGKIQKTTTTAHQIIETQNESRGKNHSTSKCDDISTSTATEARFIYISSAFNKSQRDFEIKCGRLES